MVATAQQRKGFKICEICGGVDDKVELIWTCIKCRVTSEHVYYMRTVTEDPNWVCGECNTKQSESTKGFIQGPRTPPFHNKVMPEGPSRVQFPFKRQVRPRKVKPISEEEVIKLMSGSEYVRTIKANISHIPSSMAQKVPCAAFKAKPRIPSVSVKNAAHGGRNMYSTVSPLVPKRQVRPGKVKPISEEEVIELMSGSEYVRTTKANISHRPSSMEQKVPRPAAHGGRNMYSTISPLVPRRSEGQEKVVSSKQMLHEVCSVNKWKLPEYEWCLEQGPAHITTFTCKVIVEIPVEGATSTTFSESFSNSMPKKKATMEHASSGAIWYLEKLGYFTPEGKIK